MEKVYLVDLERLKNLARELPNTRMMALAKINTLVILNMRYEQLMVDRNLKDHPYILVRRLIEDAYSMLSAWREISFIEDESAPVVQRQEMELEVGHHELFQKLWVNFSANDYEERIERYVHRLRINKLGNLLQGARCIDFGCGHGNFAHALIQEGAAYVYGIDFGEQSIAYALNARDHLGVSPRRIEFKLESVYSVSQDDNGFDFAIQNGVFHHLENEDDAYREVWRVLKPGGWFWVYTDGAGGISYDLWDASVEMLRDIPHEFIIAHLDYLNIEVGKRYHLGDGLNAVYRHTSWAELTARLGRLGFGNFRRLTGGFPTDFDDDVIAADKYGREKFGEGDLRLLAQKIA
jgi:ubiquinone/menaquinone biosynthesis C-methylase UbiE